MKPFVSPYLLRWTFEQMAQLERYSKASASGPIAIAEREISPALWDAYSIATRPNTTVGVVASLFSTRSGQVPWGTSWLPDHGRGTAG
jgi:hypothetical protein